jgi:hypothetical protein
LEEPLTTTARASARPWRWAAGLLAASLVALAAAELHGHAQRRPFQRPSGFEGVWASVGDAGQAARVWDAGQVSGRQVVVLTGRWASIPSETLAQLLGGEASRSFSDLVNPDTALLIATRAGLARSVLVVMPRAAWERRVGELSGQRGLQRAGGCATMPWMGIERRFCRPDAVAEHGEPSLVLVEPSWFAAPEAEPLEAWLARAGVTVELGLAATDDPTADDAMRARAEAFRQRVGAPSLEVGE